MSSTCFVQDDLSWHSSIHFMHTPKKQPLSEVPIDSWWAGQCQHRLVWIKGPIDACLWHSTGTTASTPTNGQALRASLSIPQVVGWLWKRVIVKTIDQKKF